jgi:hypothetical protein
MLMRKLVGDALGQWIAGQVAKSPVCTGVRWQITKRNYWIYYVHIILSMVNINQDEDQPRQITNC